MTDHNANKIDLEGQEESTPDGSNPRPAAPTEGGAPTGRETLPADPPAATKAGAVASGLAMPNPFTDAVREVPLEAELRELAVHHSGVQLTESCQIHTDTPTGYSLAALMGSQEPEDPLACIGMSVRVTRTIEAKGVPTGEASTADGGGTRMQTIITHRDVQGVVIGVLNDSPWQNSSGPPGAAGKDDLYEINTDFAADLLKDGGEETIAQLMDTYHPVSDSPLDIPAIELDFNQFELDKSGSGLETRSGPEEEPGEPAIVTETAKSTTRPNTSEAGATGAGEGSFSHQPSLQIGAAETEIQGVDLFQRDSGLPIWLRAYPYVRPKPAPLLNKRPQAYREQDHYNPVWTYVRGTRRDRLKALVKAWGEAGSPTENDQPTSEFEIRLYRGEERILQEPQPWIGAVSPEADYNRLQECDRLVMDVIKESGRLPQLEGGFDVDTPSYLTVVLPGDKAMLTAQEAIEIGVAFPYARGRHQMPLGERVIVNDLYGSPLYQPADRNFDSERSWGALTAAAVIKAMGADPNFVPDRAAKTPTGPRSYEVESHARRSPGPVRYVCRGEDCRAFGTARFGFTSEEEWLSHWNTFHVAVMPQFVCQHAGCGAMFAADPGALDKFLDHTSKRRKEEAAASLAPHRRHPILPDTMSLELRPNPFFRPPNRHDEVPQRLSNVQAPPEDFECRTLEDCVLKLRWIFRRLFGKRVEQALIRSTEAAAKKRHRTSTPVAEVTNPEKRAKSDPGRDQETEDPNCDPTPIHPPDSSAPGEPKLKMSPGVRLERFQPLEKEEEMPGVIEGQEGVNCPDAASPVPSAKSPGLTKETKTKTSKKLGTSAKETDPTEARPPSKKKRQHPSSPSSGALSTKFGSAAHPWNQTEWDRLCKATDMETGQFKGNVGTPDNPLLTYEEAAHQRGANQDLLLRVGRDIIPAEEDEFPKKKSKGDLKKLRKQAVKAQLPELPLGMLPGGWDAFGRPWALIDCPAEKVPRIPSAHGKSRVTVAALVSFPPEPFYFVNLAHLDGVV